MARHDQIISVYPELENGSISATPSRREICCFSRAWFRPMSTLIWLALTTWKPKFAASMAASKGSRGVRRIVEERGQRNQLHHELTRPHQSRLGAIRDLQRGGRGYARRYGRARGQPHFSRCDA